MAITNPVAALTQQDLLDLLGRIMPADYLAGLRDVGPGYELLQAYAAIFARASLAVERLGKDAFIDIAAVGRRATGAVQLFRAGPAPLAVAVKAGTIVAVSRSGKEYATTADVLFAPSDLGPFNVPVEAVAFGYEFNVTGQRLAADGTILEGEVDTVEVLVEDPALADITIQVRQIDDITGGEDEALPALGRDRGIIRQPGEGNPSYRERVRRLPDTISPAAIERVVANLLRPFGAGFEIIETWEMGYQTCWDAPSQPIAGSDFNPNLFVFDDPDFDGVPFRNRWLGESDYRGAFIVVVENIQPLRDTSMAYDDWAMAVGDLVSSRTGGMRAVCAYDVPRDFAFGAVHGGYDGFDLEKQALYKGLYGTLQEIKLGGVTAAVELRGA